MLRKILVILVLGAVAFAGVRSLKAENTPAPSLKVGLVDFQQALQGTEEGKKAEQSFQASVSEKKKKFDILKTELEQMKQDFEKNKLVLTGAALDGKRQSLQKKLMEVEQTGANYEQELSNKKAESIRKILTGLQSVVQQIGQKEGFTFIFEKSQGGVLFTSGAKDLTDEVIKEFNAHPPKN